jgi:hypothetical protein
MKLRWPMKPCMIGMIAEESPAFENNEAKCLFQ